MPPWAEDYGVILNVEPHGPYTTDGDFMERLFAHFESEYLRLNMDTATPISPAWSRWST